MKVLKILTILFLIPLSGCVTTALWEDTIDETHSVKVSSKLTEDQIQSYKDMAKTNSMIQVDPVTEDVYIRKGRSKRFYEMAGMALITPLTLIIDIPLFLIFGSDDD